MQIVVVLMAVCAAMAKPQYVTYSAGALASPFGYSAGLVSPYSAAYASPYSAGLVSPYSAGYASPYVAGYASPYAYSAYTSLYR